MKRIEPGLPFLISGVVFLAVGVGAAAAWHNFLPLGMGAVCLSIGVIFLVRRERSSGSK